MTDEEHLKLCNTLRAARPGYPPGELAMQAADEIERLASDLNFEREFHKIQQRGIEYLIQALTEARELLDKNFERSERIERTLALFSRN